MKYSGRLIILPYQKIEIYR